MQAKDLAGLRLGKIVVVRRETSTPRGKSRWLVRCDCGVEYVAPVDSLVGKRSIRSCQRCHQHESLPEVDGISGSIAELADRYGQPVKRVYLRLSRGWSLDDALKTPAPRRSQK